MSAPLHWLTEHVLGQNYAAWDPEKVRAAVREIADAQVERFVDLWNTEAGALDEGRGSVPGEVPASPGDAQGERVQLPPDRSARDAVVNRAREVVAETGERGHGTPAEIALEAAVREMDRQREIMSERRYRERPPSRPVKPHHSGGGMCFDV